MHGTAIRLGAFFVAGNAALRNPFSIPAACTHWPIWSGYIPARLTAEQTAWVLNCQPYDIPVLVAARLLKPLGNPQPNSVKYFASVEVLEFAKDHSWLARMTNALNLHWKGKNAAKKRDSNLLSGINLQ